MSEGKLFYQYRYLVWFYQCYTVVWQNNCPHFWPITLTIADQQQSRCTALTRRWFRDCFESEC